MADNNDIVQMGEYVIIQRQDYTKLHKVTQKGLVSLGKDQIEIAGVIGEPYWTTYKMEPKPKPKRVFELKKCTATVNIAGEIIKEVSSGVDNREITDDGSSQKLTTEEIVNLRSSGLSAQGIVSTLVENSKTFLRKTEYSQEKYLKKKEKKYFEYVRIMKPTLRQVAQILMRQAPAKVLGLRMDSLAQLNTMACVRAGGRYLLYESGCQGLVTASMLQAVGPSGTLILTHSGRSPQLNALQALNLSEQHMRSLYKVNIHHLLQSTGSAETTNHLTASNGEKTRELTSTGQSMEESVKLEKAEEDASNGESKEGGEQEEDVEESVESVEECGKRKLEEDSCGLATKKPRWEEEADRAVELLRERQVDGLVIVSKEHPANILKALLRYVSASRSFVVFSAVREPLLQLFTELRGRQDVVALRLTESWLRPCQVLEGRTHPEINISGGGGTLLSGVTVS